MGEPEELVEGVSEINLNPAPAGFWKPWGEIEEKAPAEMKNPKLVRLYSVLGLSNMTTCEISFELTT
eukprot:g28958.t1